MGVRDLQQSSKLSHHSSHYFLQNTSRLWVLACSIDTDLNYEITIFFIRTGTNKSQQSYYEKILTTFLKV